VKISEKIAGSSRKVHLMGESWVLIADLFVALSWMFLVALVGAYPLLLGRSDDATVSACVTDLDPLKAKIQSLIDAGGTFQFVERENGNAGDGSTPSPFVEITSRNLAFPSSEAEFNKLLDGKEDWNKLCSEVATLLDEKSIYDSIEFEISGLASPEYCSIDFSKYRSVLIEHGMIEETAQEIVSQAEYALRMITASNESILSKEDEEVISFINSVKEGKVEIIPKGKDRESLVYVTHDLNMRIASERALSLQRACQASRYLTNQESGNIENKRQLFFSVSANPRRPEDIDFLYCREKKIIGGATSGSSDEALLTKLAERGLLESFDGVGDRTVRLTIRPKKCL